MKSLVIVLAAMALTTTAFSTGAAQDEAQRMVTHQLHLAKQKLTAAQAAQGAARQTMMSEHMGMMQKAMEHMQAMKPPDSMTPQEQKEWIAEHRKLMDQVMGQMMDEHHLMMQTNCR